MTQGVKIQVSEEQISETISSFFQYKIEHPIITLTYRPYWFFEIHLGLEKHFGALDAVNSELFIDKPEFSNVLDILVSEIEQMQDAKYLQEIIKSPRIKEQKEAEKIAEHKVRAIYPNKEHLLANFNLLSVPIWIVEVNNKKYTIIGTDENYQKGLISDLNTDFPQKKGLTKIFVESVKDIKKPHRILFDFFTTLKNNKLVVIILLILIIFVVIFIVKKILAKI